MCHGECCVDQRAVLDGDKEARARVCLVGGVSGGVEVELNPGALIFDDPGVIVNLLANPEPRGRCVLLGQPLAWRCCGLSSALGFTRLVDAVLTILRAYGL